MLLPSAWVIEDIRKKSIVFTDVIYIMWGRRIENNLACDGAGHKKIDPMVINSLIQELVEEGGLYVSRIFSPGAPHTVLMAVCWDDSNSSNNLWAVGRI